MKKVRSCTESAAESTTFYKKDEILLLENGEYSDRSWSGPYRVLKDFEMREVAQTCKETYVPGDDDYRQEAGSFELEGWLCKNGFLEQMDSRSCHIGSYSEIRIDG